MMASTAPSTRARWRSLLLRALWVGVSSLVGVGTVGALVVWAALAIEWDVPEPPVLSGPSVVTAADGTELARFTTQVDRTPVPLVEVSEDARAAIIASEDANFYEHTGVDPLALVRAVWVNVRTGAIQQGGSTLTQQYVKNAFVGDDVTLRRKVEEAVLSISLERRLSKDEILEAYLNTVYFGEGASGIEAAAVTYFGVGADELTLAQGATLAQLLPAPSLRNPVADPDGARARRDALLDRMEELGRATPADVEAARSSDLGVVARRRDPGTYPYVVQHVRRLLTEAYGEEEVLTGALRVRTTVQPAAMTALEEAVAAQLPRQEDRPGVDAGAVAVDPATGDVLAWYGGRDHTASQFDLAMQARRRPGSTFKPIAYLAALEDGIEPDTVYPAPGAFDEGELCDPGWGPANASGNGFGRLQLREALFRSVNTVFAQVGCDVGADALAETAARLGVRTELERTPQLAIGGFGSNTTVADLAQVYATLANDGLQCPLRTILEVRDRDGRSLPLPVETTPQGTPRPPGDAVLASRPDGLGDADRGRCRQVADPDAVRRVTQALEVVVAETTGRRADIGRPQAGKTGTTDDEVDAWFAGYTPDLALVVRVGDDVEDPLTDIEGFARVQGGTIPALIWRDAAEALLADVAETAFTEPGTAATVRIPATPRSPSPSPAASPTPSPAPGPGATPTTAPSSPEPSPSPTGGGLLDPGGGGGGDGGGDDDDDDDGCGLLGFGCDPG